MVEELEAELAAMQIRDAERQIMADRRDMDSKTEGRTQKVDCTPTETALCLGGTGRFRVEVMWRTPTGESGDGQAVPFLLDTGFFWFFDSRNIELVVKVLDACSSPFESFWVFASGLTNVEVDLRVTDTLTGEMRVYRNPQGQSFQPIQDTAAFATCQ